MEPDHNGRVISKLALRGFLLALVAALAEAFSGLGSRWELWNFRVGLNLLRWTAYAGVAATALSLVGCVAARPGGGRRGLLIAVIGVVLGVLVVAIPLTYFLRARALPMIHDITTDTEDPPQFSSVVALRQDAPNPIEYGGPEIAAQQKRAYPDIQPVKVELPLAEAFEKALKAAQNMKWDIVAADRENGRIEATDTTFWFGFKDDIVIRIRPADTSSRIDIRSLSRVGRSDLGTNARRIREYTRVFKTGSQ